MGPQPPGRRPSAQGGPGRPKPQPKTQAALPVVGGFALCCGAPWEKEWAPSRGVGAGSKGQLENRSAGLVFPRVGSAG
jgi:hypothetical protein